MVHKVFHLTVCLALILIVVLSYSLCVYACVCVCLLFLCSLYVLFHIFFGFSKICHCSSVVYYVNDVASK